MSESRLKLYRVDVVTSLLVLAEDPDEAISTAEMNFSEVANIEADSPMEISEQHQLPGGWAKSIPYYEGAKEVEEFGLTCTEILALMQNRQALQAEADAKKVAQEQYQVPLFPSTKG
jgi:hypothetical protein